MSITYRKMQPAPRVQAIVRDKRGASIATKIHPNKKKAKVWAEKIEHDQYALDQYRADGANITFKLFADKYLENYAEEAEANPSRYVVDNTEWWVKRFDTMLLKNITDDVIENVLRKYGKGKATRFQGNAHTKKDQNNLITTKRTISPKTIQNKRNHLSAMFVYAIGYKLLRHNPIDILKARKRPKGKKRGGSINNKITRYLDHERLNDEPSECERLLQACRDDSYNQAYLLIILMIVTGARKMEILNARWTDINWHNKTLSAYDYTEEGQRIMGQQAVFKNGEVRVMPLDSVALEELLKHRKTEGLIFPATKITHAEKSYDNTSMWKRVCKRAGIVKLRFHDLRHTTASWLISDDVNEYVTGEVLGHKDRSSTARYAHLSHKRKADAVTSTITPILRAAQK